MDAIKFTCKLFPGVNQIPKFPSIKNPWARAAALGKIRDVYQDHVQWCIEEVLGGQPAPRWESAEMEITLHFPDRRHRDIDNFSGGGGYKWLQDAVVKAGVIADDRAGILKPRPPTFDIDRENPRCEVIVRRT